MKRYKLSYRLKKLYIYWRRFNSIWFDRFITKKENLTTYQSKSIRLWKMILRNPNSILQYNTSGTRQLEHNDIMMIFISENVLTIMDLNTHRKCVYEINIPETWGEEVNNYFDVELARRMREVENSKRSIIGDDLDTLIRQEERYSNRVRSGLSEM